MRKDFKKNLRITLVSQKIIEKDKDLIAAWQRKRTLLFLLVVMWNKF